MKPNMNLWEIKESQEFEELIDLHGPDQVTQLMQKVISALEQLEVVLLLCIPSCCKTNQYHFRSSCIIKNSCRKFFHHVLKTRSWFKEMTLSCWWSTSWEEQSNILNTRTTRKQRRDINTPEILNRLLLFKWLESSYRKKIEIRWKSRNVKQTICSALMLSPFSGGRAL